VGALIVLAVHNAATPFDLTQTHKSIGVSVLVLTLLTLLRLGMRCFFRAPKLEPIARSVVIVGRAVHVGLYVLLLLLPFFGWLRDEHAVARGDYRVQSV
jgi:cytochrome b561